MATNGYFLDASAAPGKTKALSRAVFPERGQGFCGKRRRRKNYGAKIVLRSEIKKWRENYFSRKNKPAKK
jgi:hypothetical protein